MKNSFLLALLVLPAAILTFDNGSRLVASAEEDELEDELVDVEGEADTTLTGDDLEEAPDTGASPDADTTILFTKPLVATGSQLEIPAGNLVEFLVGFANKGEQEFIIESLDASFRYPQDFNYHIQNFSTIAYSRVVPPGQEATLVYSFLPSEAFAGRPFGLSVNLQYRDASGLQFHEAVYNSTVQITDVEEGLDGETFFLYVFLAAIVVLLLVLGQQFLSSVGRKRPSQSAAAKRVVETGTSNPHNVDYDWLPKQTLNQISKSPKSPKQNQSPRQRKAKRSAGDD